MAKIIKTIILIALLTYFSSVPTFNASAIEDAIIAIINDELITAKDLADYIQSTYMTLVAQKVDPERIKLIMQSLKEDGLTKLIQDKLILSRANEVKLEVRKKAIDDELQSFIDKYPSEKDFVDSLVKYGGTMTDFRKKIEEQFKIKYIIEEEVKSKIFVNPQEVTDYYEKNKSQFEKQERVDLDSIYIAFANDKATATNKANEAMKALNEGKDFAEVAKQYSNTPSIGIVEKGSIMPEIEEAVFKLNIGEISPLIEVDTGIYLFKLKEKLPKEVATIEEVKNLIYKYLYQKKFEQKFTRWLSNLTKKAYVEIKR